MIQNINLKFNFLTPSKKLPQHPLFAPCFDTVSFSGRKTKKQIAGYDENKIVKRFTKKGAGGQNINAILKDNKKREHLENFIIEYEKGNLKFLRPPKEREIALSISENFNNEELETLIEYVENKKPNSNNKPLSRPLKLKEAIFVLKEKMDEAQIQRALTLSDLNEDGKPYLSGQITFKEGCFYATNGFDDVQSETYLKYLESCEIPRSAFLENIKDRKKCDRFLYFLNNKNLQRNMTPKEAICATQRGMDDKKAQRFISLVDNGLDGYKAELYPALEIAGKNFDDKRASVYLRILQKGGTDPHAVVTQEEKYQKFLHLTDTENPPFQREITDEEACDIIYYKLKDDEIENWLKAVHSNIAPYRAVFLIRKFNKFIKHKSLEELSKPEKMELLTKILEVAKERPYFYEDSEGKSFSPLVPTNIKNYSSIVGKLSKDLEVDFKPLSDKEIEDFNEEVSLKKESFPSEEFEKLDKENKFAVSAALYFCDLNKEEEENSALFKTFFALQKLNLDEDLQLKIYQLVKINLLLNKFEDNDSFAQNCAFEMRHKDLDLFSKILYSANGGAEISFEKIEEYLNKIKSTQIFVPQTKIPKASELKGVETMEKDGVQNKVINLKNAPNDLSLLGFEKGTTKENLSVLVHGLDFERDMLNVNAFSIIDSDAILSTSLITPEEYKCFRQQGLVLESYPTNVFAGYFRDFGSGSKKNMTIIKDEYLFNNRSNEKTRTCRSYISSLLKEALGLEDSEYIKLTEKLKGAKSITDFEKIDKNFANALNKIYKGMELGKRQYDRQYNEFLISNPKIKGVFAYDQKYEKIPFFLRKYAEEKDIPIIIF